MENTAIQSFPSTIPIKSLTALNADYQDTTKQDDFYHAGDSFPAGKYLRWRDMEKRQEGNPLRLARVQAATLEPVLSGVIDFLVGATIKSKLNILAKDDESGYYSTLNDSIGKTQRELLLKGILHIRSYLLLVCPYCDYIPSNLEQQKALGGLDFSLSVLTAQTVTDWKEDSTGALEWAKTYVSWLDRSNPDAIWIAPDICVHEWTFFTSDSIATYRATTIVENGTAKMLEQEGTAGLVSVIPHSLNACPIIPFMPSSQIIDRILPIADAHFQRTSSLTFALDTTAWSIPVICTGKPISEVVSNETSALVLNQGDTVTALGPNANQSFTALSSNAEYLADQLFKVIQAASLNSYQSGQNTSRLSAAARRHEASYMEVLLSSYGDDLEATYRKAVELIQEARQDENDISFGGADDYNAESLTATLDFLAKLLPLPVAATAKQYALADVAAKIVSSAPEAIRSKVADESADIDLDIETPDEDEEDDPDEKEIDKEGIIEKDTE